MVKVDMTRFPGISSDLQFVERLVSEESVFCLPGKCFNYPNYIRIVLTVPGPLLEEACNRIHEFCSTHLVCPPPSRLVGLLVDNRSLYATYGKRYGQFVDNPHVDKYAGKLLKFTPNMLKILGGIQLGSLLSPWQRQ